MKLPKHLPPFPRAHGVSNQHYIELVKIDSYLPDASKLESEIASFEEEITKLKTRLKNFQNSMTFEPGQRYKHESGCVPRPR